MTVYMIWDQRNEGVAGIASSDDKVEPLIKKILADDKYAKREQFIVSPCKLDTIYRG